MEDFCCGVLNVSRTLASSKCCAIIPRHLSKLNGKSVPHLGIIQEWEVDMTKWPHITYENSLNDFVLCLSVDGSGMRSYKSTESYQYLQSCKLGRMLKSWGWQPGVPQSRCPAQSEQNESSFCLDSCIICRHGTGCSCVSGQVEVLQSCSLAYYGSWLADWLFVYHNLPFLWVIRLMLASYLDS